MNLLKVMTFNLRGSMMQIDGANYWPHRADLNIRTLQKYTPDLIGFQEFQTGHLAAYQEHLPDYAYELGLNSIDDSDYGMKNPIYWRRDRFDLLASGGFYLSDTPEVWSDGWDGVFVRCATWVHLHDKVTDSPLMMLNTHLDHIGEQARRNGTRLIVSQLPRINPEGWPTVITGDFNARVWAMEDHGGVIPEGMEEEATPAGIVHEIFLGAGFRDTFTEAGHDEGIHTNTFHDFKGTDYPAIGQRIDWILIQDGKNQRLNTLACDILQDAEPPLYPSDHYPVMAVLRVESSE
jgi:endonuclease/exonuclease/phosphatase family metal-dependent hydrolase